jgi:N-acetylmuramoyl-L-alanine amidase
VVDLPAGTPAPHSYVKTIRCTGLHDTARTELFLDEKLPFQVEEHLDENLFVLRVFGVTSDTDWIRYMNTEGLIDRAEWSQESEGVYRLNVYLEQSLIWGWDCYYKGNTLVLDVERGPKATPSFKDVRFVIDPGHSKDPGAIGPTGLKEAEANLAIALRLAELLRKKGATVFMTRTDDSDVKLQDRPRIAMEKKCDIFISVHNNSCPDGVNPYCNNGVSTYYYNPHSMDLARSVQNRMLSSLSLEDHGLYYGNLAVARPTQYVAILVECTFIIIPEQEAALRTEKFQDQCARSIADGIDDYFNTLGNKR